MVTEHGFGNGEIFLSLLDLPVVEGLNLEDEALPIDLTAVLADTDGSETLSVTLSGFPAGASFNLGAAQAGDWVIENAQAIDLSTLVMTPPLDYNGAFTLTVNATATEASNGDAATTTVSADYTITAVNDAPVFDAPGVVTSFTLPEDSAIQLIGLSVFDVDAGTGEVSVTLEVANGALSLGTTSGLTLTDGGGSDGTLAFTGTVADVNAALAALDYAGDENFNGEDTLNITVDDQGNTGSGGALSDSASVVIDVAAVNDAAGISGVATGEVTEDGGAKSFKLTAFDGAANDYFGYSSAVSADGGTFVVGGYQSDSGEANAGSAYVFDSDGSLVAKLVAPDGVLGDQFGWSVDVSAEGGTIVVGAPGDDDVGSGSGAAYVFSRDGSFVTKLTASDAAGGDLFGASTSVSGDGNTIVVGAYQEDTGATNSGSVYLYRFDGTSWQQDQKLTAFDAATNDFFGQATAVSDDGGTIVVGSSQDDNPAVNSGSACVYDANGSLLGKLSAPDAESSDTFGESVSVSGDGTTIVIGARLDDDNGSDSGSAYVYSRDGIFVRKLTAPDAVTSDLLGQSTAVSADGNIIVLGAIGDDEKGNSVGSVYVFNRDGVLLAKLTAADGVADDTFGLSVSVSADGGTILTGARLDDDNGLNSGSAYVLQMNADGNFVDFEGNIYGPDGHIGTQPPEVDPVASGQLTITDVDAGEAALQGVAAGTAGDNGYGSFEVGSDGAWTFTLDNANAAIQALAEGETLTDTITVTSVDATATQVIEVTINGTNDAPTLGASAVTLSEDGPVETVDLALFGDDIDNDDDGSSLVYTITGAPSGGTAVITGTSLSFDPAADFQSLELGEQRDVTVEITATDAHGATAVNEVVFTLIGADEGPAVFDINSLGTSTGFAFTDIEAENDIGLGVQMRVANIGDFNGDGVDDFAVGAANNGPNGSTDNGVAYVVYGASGGLPADLTPADLTPADLDGVNGFTIPGASSGSTVGDLLGNSITGVGDMNGDGYDDLAVSAFYGDPDGEVRREGQAYVLYGTASLGTATVDPATLAPGEVSFIAGGNLDRGLGSDIANAGDVNGDGFDDLIISTENTNGKANVLFGSATGLPDSIDADEIGSSVPGIEVTGQGNFGFLGKRVSGAGDLNGDGIDDLIVTEGLKSNTEAFDGSAYVVFGATGLSNINVDTLAAADGFEFQGLDVFDGVGLTVASAGDVNDDGLDDLIIGGGNGEAYVIFGDDTGPIWAQDRNDLDGSNGFTIKADPADGGARMQAVSGAGDVDNDGIDDLLISTRKDAFVVYGSDTGFDAQLELALMTAAQGFKIDGMNGEVDVSAAGDINDDGIADILLADWSANAASEAYVIYGDDFNFV